MERSGPDDARDDAPDDGWNDDASRYPAAPIPTHERTWRHPSEMGHAAWVTSEPPVTIGRALLVTSGAIGSALGVAVLYLLLPAGVSAPSASPTVTSSISSLRPVVSAPAETTVLTALLNVASTEARISEPGVTLPAPDTPSTVLVMARASTSDQPISVAVAIEGDPYVVTTANALESIGEVNLLGPGDTELTPLMSAELVSIEGDLAYLAPFAQMEVVSFAATASAEPGQIVTVLADSPTDVSYVASGTSGGVPELDAGRIVEGTPVVDERGALVALCTLVIDADGAHVELIAIEPAPADETVPPSSNDTSSSEPSTDTDSNTGTDTDTDTGGGGGAGTVTIDDTVAVGNSNGTNLVNVSTTTTTSPVSTPAASPVTTTIAGITGSGPSAWAGLRFDGSSSSPLTITGVVAGSPAMAAGVMVGERVVAIDGTDVATIDDVIAALKRHQPGDVMKLTLVGRSAPTSNTSGSTTTTTTVGGASNGRTISVVLAAFAPTL